jgi:hypothetical protein
LKFDTLAEFVCYRLDLAGQVRRHEYGVAALLWEDPHGTAGDAERPYEQDQSISGPPLGQKNRTGSAMQV